MADLDIYYKGNKIFTADDDVRENLNTAGTYCEEDIIVDYKKPTLPPLTNPATDSEVIDGYEYYDDQGIAQTGSFVPPVDTGANGQMRDCLEGETNDLIDDTIIKLRRGALYYSNVRILALPLCAELQGQDNVRYSSYLKAVYLPNLSGFLPNTLFKNCSSLIDCYIPQCSGGTGTGNGNGAFSADTNLVSVSIDNGIIIGGYESFEGCTALKTLVCTHTFTSSAYPSTFNYCTNLDTIVCLFDTVPPIESKAISSLNPTKIVTGGGYFYVYKNLVDEIKSATNWTVIANAIVGIDVRISINKGATFIPSYSGTEVTHWDIVKLQSYDCATINSLTGEITSTKDGRVLVRGLDANDEIKYVAFVEIGNKFDYTAVDLT